MPGPRCRDRGDSFRRTVAAERLTLAFARRSSFASRTPRSNRAAAHMRRRETDPFRSSPRRAHRSEHAVAHTDWTAYSTATMSSRLSAAEATAWHDAPSTTRQWADPSARTRPPSWSRLDTSIARRALGAYPLDVLKTREAVVPLTLCVGTRQRRMFKLRVASTGSRSRAFPSGIASRARCLR